MVATFTQIIQNKTPEEERQTPVVMVRRITTGAGGAAGASLIDSFLIGLSTTPVNLTVVLRPDDPLRFEVRQITVFNPATGEVTPGTAFSAQVAAGTPYGLSALATAGAGGGVAVPVADAVANVLSSDVVGNKADTASSAISATSSLMRYLKAVVNMLVRTRVSGITGVSNFNAGAVNVISLAPAVVQRLEGIRVGYSTFTANAILTVRVFINVNGTELQIYQQVTQVGVAPYPQAFPVDLSGVTIPGVASSYRVSLQSDNAGDNARQATFEYYTQPGSV